MARIEWLGALSPEAARTARRAIRHHLKSLELFPAAGQACGNDERKLPIPFGRDGFVAVYRVEADRVVIARILHGRQDRQEGGL